VIQFLTLISSSPILVLIFLILFHIGTSALDKCFRDIFIEFTIPIFSVHASFTNPLLVTIANYIVSEIPHIEVGGIMSVRRSDTPTSIEDHLPYPGNTREQVSTICAVADVPHLQRPVRSRKDLKLVMLETSDRPSVRCQGMQEISAGWIPDSQC
jgi:hypothetical protein